MNTPSTFSSPIRISKQDDTLHTLGEVMVFRSNNHDFRQLWLPFVSAIFLRQDVKAVKTTVPQKYRGRGHLFFIVHSPFTQLYHPEKDVPQLILPFEGWRKVRSGNMRQLGKTAFPGWERNENGSLLTVLYDGGDRPDMEEFIDLNFIGRYRLHKDKVMCELVLDYIKLKIGYGVAK